MSLVDEQAAFLLDVCKLIPFAVSKGFVVTGGELQRPIEMQVLRVQSKQSTTMDSNHLRKCAIDLFFFIEGKYISRKAALQELGDYWESLNKKNSWGGNWNSFKDTPHFERRR